MKSILFFLGVLALFSCSTPKQPSAPQPKESDAPSIPDDSRKVIESAHQLNEFRVQDGIEFDLELYFRGKLRLQAKNEITTAGDFIRINYRDGRTLCFDGKDVLVHPDTAKTKGARFDIFTWSYFFALPYKLTDPGTNWKDLGTSELNGKTYNLGKLTFGDGVGDAPDDWYMIYSDPKTNLVEVAAYIVTYSSSEEEAEEDPHAIAYHDIEMVDGVPVATRWTFHSWRKDSGLIDTLGHGALSGIHFTEVDTALQAPRSAWKVVSK